MAKSAQSPICYVLREPKSKTLTPIIGIIRFNNDRVKIPTGFKIIPSHWNSEKNRVKNVLDATDRDKINNFLKDLETETGRIINDIRANRQFLTKEIIKERVNKYLKPSSVDDKPQTLIQFLHWYISTCPTRLVRSKGSRAGRVMSPNTIRRYKTTLNGIEAFATTYPRALTFENIDSQFYQAFTEWLTSKKYSANNVSKYIENLKGFMSIAVEEGLTNNQEFRKFANLREESENIYLNELELQNIYELDLSKYSKLERVRDLFIFGAWTGLRFSDLSLLRPEHIHTDENGLKHIDIRQQKTSNRVQIPILHYSLEELLIKYDNHLPQSISNQKTNDYLKEICKMAGIDKIVIKHITKGGKQVIKTSDGYSEIQSSGIEKWHLVSTHTARRSFATNMFRNGMETLLIMKITGHKRQAEFLKYIKITPEETLKQMRIYYRPKPSSTEVTNKVHT